MHSLWRGSLAGFLATGPMTFALLRIFQKLPRQEQSPLPPATITNDVMELVGGEDIPANVLIPATIAAHFGYGALMGTIYSLALSENGRMPWWSKGSLYGLGVWGFSYLGLLPALDFRSRADHMPLNRNGMMIGAHIVWGLSLAYADEILKAQGNDMWVGNRKARGAE